MRIQVTETTTTVTEYTIQPIGETQKKHNPTHTLMVCDSDGDCHFTCSDGGDVEILLREMHEGNGSGIVETLELA